jgi:hypothetical protein
VTGNAVVVNFSGGETSPRSRARFDQPWYQTSAKKMLNFIAEIQGPARFRTGTIYSYQTRLGAVARAFDFEVNDVLAYLLEFTPGYLRVRNPVTQNLLTTTQAAITSITKASPAVVTVASASGLANGQEVILSNVVGMPQLNNKQFLISGLSGNTFSLADPVTAALLDTSAYPAVATAGTAAVVYEITTPYSAADIANLQVAATRSTMYLTTGGTQSAQKLTVDSNNAFTIGSFTRTNDPFSQSTALSLLGITPGVLYDDFESGLGLWTPTLMTTSSIFGSSLQAVSSDTARVTPGYTSASLLAAQATGGAGNWEFDIVKTDGGLGGGDVVPDSTGTSFAGVVNAFVRFLPIYKDATNFYELRVYGTDCNTFRLYFNNAGVASLLGTFTGAAVSARSSHIRLNRDGSGVWTLYQDGTILGTATENTLTTSVSTYFYLTAPISKASGTAFTTNNVGIDNVFLPAGSATAKTLIWFPSGIIPGSVSYTFSGVVGAVTINGGTYKLSADGSSNVAYLKTLAGADVNSSGWGAYVSGGVATAVPEHPLSVAFYEGRLVYGGTDQRPDCLFLSRSPDNNGNSRYDDFTGGSNADFACFFQLAPTGGSTNYISWTRGGPDYLFLGTFGGPYRVSGSGLDIPITPSSINVRQFDTAGAEETMPAGLQQMFFIQRAGKTLRSIKVINPYLATFESADMCLNAEQIGYSPIQRVVLQRGRPDSLWIFCADGTLAGMSVHITVQQSDTLSGWHRHKLGGGGKVVDIAVVSRQTGFDQLWVVVQRTINGASRCYVEVMADDVVFPDPEDFYAASGAIVRASDNPQRVSTAANGSKAADLALWGSAVWRAQASYVHMDSEVSYDGSLRGTTAAATLTPSAVGAAQVAGQAAVPITLTAGQAVFTAADVGSEIWVKPNAVTGLGGGRATITVYTSSTVVSAVVTVPFASTAAVAAGDWYFAVSTFYGYGHLEGARVAVLGDGAVLSDGGQTGDPSFATLTVTKGTITLPSGNLGQQQRAAVLRGGLPYTGVLETHNLEMGGRSGPAQSKPRSISEINIRFMNSLGCEYGTDLYNMEKIEHRLSDANYDRPAPVFSGLRRLKLEDSWSGLDDATREKNVFVTQRLPLPAVVQFLDLAYSTADDGGVE